MKNVNCILVKASGLQGNSNISRLHTKHLLQPYRLPKHFIDDRRHFSRLMLNRTSRYINTLFAVFAFVLPHGEGFLISQIFSDLSTATTDNSRRLLVNDAVHDWKILFCLLCFWRGWRQLFHQRQTLISWLVNAHVPLIRNTLIKDARKRKTISLTKIPWTLVANENLTILMLDFYAAQLRATFTLSHI